MPESRSRSAADRAADVRARKARIRPAVTWGDIAARTAGPEGEPYAEGTVKLAANVLMKYPDAVLDAIELALDGIEAERVREAA